jgi:hypothetical protein
MSHTVWGDDPQTVKGRAVFDAWHAWRYGLDRRSGRPFFLIDGSEPGDVWYADPNDCTCPDRRYRRGVCKHMVAVRLWCAALLDGQIDSQVVTVSDRRQLFAGLAMTYDLDTAERADSLLEAYERQQAEREEARVADAWPDPEPEVDWPEAADDGRPVWLEPGDRWEPDATIPSRRHRAPEPEVVVDPRDAARHARQLTRYVAPRERRPAGGTVQRAPDYWALYPEEA